MGHWPKRCVKHHKSPFCTGMLLEPKVERHKKNRSTSKARKHIEIGSLIKEQRKPSNIDDCKKNPSSSPKVSCNHKPSAPEIDLAPIAKKCTFANGDIGCYRPTIKLTIAHRHSDIQWLKRSMCRNLRIVNTWANRR